VLDAPWGFALWGLARLPRPCLIVTQCPSPHYLRDLMDLQPEGILATSANPEDVLQGLQAIAQDQPFHKLPPLGPDSLTTRERQVMRQVALGLCDDQIAWRLGVSKRTVYNWVTINPYSVDFDLPGLKLSGVGNVFKRVTSIAQADGSGNLVFNQTSGAEYTLGWSNLRLGLTSSSGLHVWGQAAPDVAEDCVTAKTQVDSTGSGSEEVYIRLQ
jgi:hypothetical protein